MSLRIADKKKKEKEEGKKKKKKLHDELRRVLQSPDIDLVRVSNLHTFGSFGPRSTGD